MRKWGIMALCAALGGCVPKLFNFDHLIHNSKRWWDGPQPGSV
jgi:hypothetical protein